MSHRRYLVYQHKNKVNGKIYIGYTSDLKRRIGLNGNGYRPNNQSQSYFWNAIQKYGWDQFETTIVKDDMSLKDALEFEVYYINYTNCRNIDIGYNIAEGGRGGIIYKEHPRGMLGKHQSTLQRTKSVSLMAHHQNKTIRRKLIRVSYPDGQIVHFPSMSKCALYLRFSLTFLKNRLNEQTPYRSHGDVTSTEGLSRYRGCVFTFKDILR